MFEFKRPALEDRGWVEELLALGEERGCEYNFSTLYLWCHAFHVEVARVGDFFTEWLCAPNGCHYLFPVGRGDLGQALDALRADSRRRGVPFSLTGVNPEDRETLEALCPGRFQYTPNRFSFDYLYDIHRMADLGGKKLHAKRNHIHRFEENHPDWTFEPLCRDNLGECLAMNAQWHRQNNTGADGAVLDNSLGEEETAIRKAMEQFDTLGLEGGLLRTEGQVVAFTVGDKLHANSDTYNVHFEKAFGEVQGAYPLINREFARWVRENHPEIRYLNREEDMGLEGLRKAKESYYPDLLLEKYLAAEVE
jgi:hypothetical protein